MNTKALWGNDFVYLNGTTVNNQKGNCIFKILISSIRRTWIWRQFLKEKVRLIVRQYNTIHQGYNYFENFWQSVIDTFKYRVSCTDGKISVRINYFFTYFSTVVPPNSLCFFPVGLLLLIQPHKTWWKCINNESSTGKKHTTVGWDDVGKLGKIIN